MDEDEHGAQKIRDFFVDFAGKLREIAERHAFRNDRGEAITLEKNTEALVEIANVLDDALNRAGRAEGRNGQEEKLAIATDSKGRSYVKLDRQVISGDDPVEWGEQVKSYIDEEIRKGRNVRFTGADGDILTIASDTAGKARFRNDVRMSDGRLREMNDEEYARKLRAEVHVDELAQVSSRGPKAIPDTKKHWFAKDGWNYRTAYFEDVDGVLYKATISVGRKGEVNTVYNVGKINKKREPGSSDASGSKAKRNESASATGPDVSDISISYPSGNVNEKLSLKADGDMTQLIEDVKAEEKTEALDEAARIANRTVKKYKSTISRGDVAAEIDQMIDAYQNHDDAAAEKIADGLAKKVIEQSTKTDVSHREGYEEIRRRLREKGSSLTDTQKQEAANRYGSYNDWRKSIMGSVKVKMPPHRKDAAANRYKDQYFLYIGP